MRRLLLSCILFSISVAHAQVSTGTIVIFQVTEDRFVIAADSRAVPGVGTMPPEDNHCKISAFKSYHAVVALSASAFYRNRGSSDLNPSWDALKEAENAIVAEERMEPLSAVNAMNNIASYWESRMLSIWQSMTLYEPELVAEVAQKENGHLSTGTFAVARNGLVAAGWTLIVLDNGKPTVFHPDKNCMVNPCAAGMTTIVTKYMNGGTEFMTAYPSTIESWGYELLRIMRLADLTIAEDASGNVGGRIDALELWNDGTIRWRTKKENCPETQDTDPN
jgi:hypothetical protein